MKNKRKLGAAVAIYPTVEGSTGQISYQDLAVPVTSISVPLADIPITNLIGVACTKPSTDGEDANGELITVSIASENISQWVNPNEAAYIGHDFVGSFYLWNTDLTEERNQAILKDMNGKVGTLIVIVDDEGVANYMLNQSTYKNIVIILQKTAETTDAIDQFAKKEKGCVFIDTNAEAKALWVASRYLQTYGSFPPMPTLRNDVFTGITDPDESVVLDKNGFSYFFKATNACFCRNFQIGNQQARVVYADYIVQNLVQQAAVGLIGAMYNQASLDILKASINGAMVLAQKNQLTNSTKSIDIPQYRDILQENIREGIVPNVVVNYYYGVEIRTIQITVEGSYV